MKNKIMKISGGLAIACIIWFCTGCSVEREIKIKPSESVAEFQVPLLTQENIPTNDAQCIEFLEAHGIFGDSLCGIYRCRRGMGDSEIDALTYTLERYVGL